MKEADHTSSCEHNRPVRSIVGCSGGFRRICSHWIASLFISRLTGLSESLTTRYWSLNWWLVCCVSSALLSPAWFVLMESVCCLSPCSGPTSCQIQSVRRQTATEEAAAPTTSGPGANWAPPPTSDPPRPITGLSCKMPSIITREQIVSVFQNSSCSFFSHL